MHGGIVRTATSASMLSTASFNRHLVVYDNQHILDHNCSEGLILRSVLFPE
jgi:hypothetical protein